MKTVNQVVRIASTAAVLCILITTFFHVEAQPRTVEYVPEPNETYDPTIDAVVIPTQGSPRSALDDQRVFLFGDSQVVGAPGAALMHHLTAAGAVYYSRSGQVGWGVRRWHRNRYQLNSLLRQHHPTLVVIILGGNDWQRVRRADYASLLQNFWAFINDRTRVHAPEGSVTSICWIGPARITGPRIDEIQPGRDLVARAILATVGDDHFVHSNDVTGTFGRSRDGLHFTPGGASDWMRQMTPRLARCVERQHPNIRQP